MSIVFGVGSPGTPGAASGGKVYAYNNLSTTPEMVAPVNTARKKITFHNPGAVDAFIAPAFVQTNGSNVALSPLTSALGGCVRVFANGGTFIIEGECQGQWNAFSASATGNPLTVIDTNV